MESLTISDAENAQKAVLSLMLEYPEYPTGFEASNKTIKWSSINQDLSIGLFPLQGAVYLGKYVDGSYMAQMPFQIVFKSAPTTNKANIDAQTLVDDIGKWMETCTISFDETGMYLESIERTSTVFMVQIDEKTTGYGINMNLKYLAEH